MLECGSVSEDLPGLQKKRRRCTSLLSAQNVESENSLNGSDLETKMKGSSLLHDKSNKRANGSFREPSGDLKKAKASTNSLSKREMRKDDPSSDGSSDLKEVIIPKVSRPKRAAAGTNFKEKRVRLDESNAKIEAKHELKAGDETDMLMMTRSASEAETPERRITDFSVHDGEGNLSRIEDVAHGFTFLGGLCMLRGSLDKDKAARCETLGPLTSWSIMGYEKDSVEICLSSSLVDYYCEKPSPNYRKIFNPLYDQARVCRDVYRALSRPDGGDPTMSLSTLELKLFRLYSNLGTSGQFFSRVYFHDIGAFVVNQLYALDEHASDGCQLFSGLQALEDLQFQSSESRKVLAAGGAGGHLGVARHEGAHSADSPREDDWTLARRLQDEEDGFRIENVGDRGGNRSARRAPASKGKFYVKINEVEIANDYPEPAFYKSDEPETDEYLVFGEDVHPDDEHFPHRKLDDWTLYDSDSRLVSLELLPMLPGAETDMQIFGSGVISEDDGSGYVFEDEGAGSKMVSSAEDGGFRVFLSAVKEWKVEWGSDMVIISFRTDGSWYRLGTPSQQYIDWYNPVLKIARIAIKIITMLKEENRVSRLSFTDVVKKLAEQSKTEATWISSKIPEVERFVIVHGQIILQQFAEYPDQLVQKSGFIVGLATKMEQKSHVKLSVSKKRILVKKEVNLNPRAKLGTSLISKRNKPMRATTTQLVNRIWSGYFDSELSDAGQPVEGENISKGPELVAEELIDEDSDDDVVEIPASLSPPKSTTSYCRSSSLNTKKLWKSNKHQVKWVGMPVGRTPDDDQVYERAVYQGLELRAGQTVALAPNAMKLLLIEYLYETGDYGPMIHGRLFMRGNETILGDAANEREIFLTGACKDVEISQIHGVTIAEMRQWNWGHEYRKENALKEEKDRARAKERQRKGLQQEFFYKSWWSPERGAFFSLSKSSVGVGSGSCNACQTRQENEKKMEPRVFEDGKGFRWQGVDYRINDYLYLDPDALTSQSDKSHVGVTHKGGRNKGLSAFIVCQLLSVIPSQRSKLNTCSMKVKRFYRPEDVDKLKAYKAQLHEVYYSEETSVVEMSTVRGKCEVRRKLEHLDTTKGSFDHVFCCDYIHDPKKQTLHYLPLNVKLGSANQHGEELSSKASGRTRNAKGKGKAVVEENIEQADHERNKMPALATLDIFAGCGGLSEGLHQSGVGVTKWAIEYDREAADAFKVNHPETEVFCDNCNVVLRSIMEKGGDLDDCISTPEAEDLCAAISQDLRSKLPMPGEVDFINGGPPCQGFSGMNRFNQRIWSKVQCEMILAFLSYADYFRPRYFLLENVRNFISFNKGQTFRLALVSLLEMGYQVRFGILQAGNFGISQSRKRAFIWAAGPDEILPEWPEPRHVFASSQIGISLPGGGQYSAVGDTGRGAPFRSITVRDTIADLPPVANGADTLKTTYTSPSESWFQMHIRGKVDVLTDHISKEMNELNLIRCQRIPKKPGADWRDLPAEKVKLSTGQSVDLIPWCLPNTAARHNQWKGLFGRLDWDGNFPTSITDPQPMGKVGMCFHPVQDRIVTVRECARSQGFPDSYKFSGNINCKHRQIGNAVPPPLACALGHKLKEAINAKTRRDQSFLGDVKELQNGC